MSFKECLDSAVERSQLTEERSEQAKSAYDVEYESAISRGMDPGSAADHAAKAAVESITNLNAQKRWQKVKQLQAAHAIQKRLRNADDTLKELEQIMAEVEVHYKQMQGVAMSTLDKYLLEYQPRIGTTGSTRGLNEIVRAAKGEPASPEAKAHAQALRETIEFLNNQANMHGAALPRTRKNWLFQTHDAAKVSRVRRYTLENGTETNTWVEEHLRPGVLDWEEMRFDGNEIKPENRREVLKRTFDGIISDGAMRDKYLIEGSQGNLANRLSRDRFLHYASADAWIEMQGKYGQGNLFQQTIGMIDHLAKDISLLRTFGPSADTMRQFATRVAKQEHTRKNPEFAAAKAADRAVSTFNAMYEIHDRRVTSADGNFMVQAISGFRTIAVGSKLGGVLIPSFFGDLANSKVISKLFGMPQHGMLRRYFEEVASGSRGIEEAIRMGIIYENGIGLAQSQVRYFGALDGPHFARVFSDQVYRIGLAAQHTQISRNMVGKHFLGVLHDTKNIPFNEHPMMAAMMEHGIDAADWDRMRAFKSKDVNGAKFLVPMDMLRAGGPVEAATAEKFGNLLQDYIRTAIPEPTLRSRVSMLEAADPNRAMVQLTRTGLSLLSHPFAIHHNHIKRILSVPDIRDKARFAAMYAVQLTIAGAVITQAKALINGQNLHDMSPTNVDFWGRALVNGGSMGILGDVMMNYININNSSYRPGDPTTELLKAIHKLTIDNVIDVAQGKDADLGVDVLDLGNQLMPRFWHTKLIMERAFLDELEQQVDPAGYREALRYEQQHEEGMWWGTGRDPEVPELSTAFGR